MWYAKHIYVAVTRAKWLQQIFLVKDTPTNKEDIKYRNTRIYKVISPNSNRVYIGYTTWPNLQEYFETCHIKEFEAQKKKQRTSKHIIICGKSRVELIENWPCTCMDEALARETYWIEKHPNAVNQVIPAKFWQEERIL